jgi:hypothetical protein
MSLADAQNGGPASYAMMSALAGALAIAATIEDLPCPFPDPAFAPANSP